MAETTALDWCDSTWNPWIGCTKVSPGCDHCYAEVSTPARSMRIVWGPHAQRHRTAPGNWQLPQRWDAGHARFFAAHGHRRRVFCASLADVFDNQVDPAWRADLWALVRATPHLDWMVLTKRIGNVPAMLPADWEAGYPNVWLGSTVVDQAEADRDLPRLLRTPAARRWLSMEPLLGPVTLPLAPEGAPAVARLDWVLLGGESGRHPRPMAEAWLRDVQRQCRDAGIAFFFKQWGGASKDKGGAVLDGQLHQAWPVA